MIWLVDLVLLGSTVVADGALSGRRYSPLSIFAVCWLGPLFLRHLTLVDYEPMQGHTAVMLYGGFLCFAIVYAIIVTVARHHWTPRDDRQILEGIDERALTTICIGLASLGALATIVQVRSVIASQGLVAFLVDPLEVREAFQLTGWGVLYQLNGLVPALLVVRHRMRNDRLDRITVILGVVVVVGLILANQKQALVKAGIVAATVATLFESRVRLRGLVLTGLLLLGFFVGYARVTSPYYSGDHRFYVRDGHIDLPAVLAPLGNPYHYLTSGYGNVQVLTHDLEPFDGGGQTLRPFRYLWLRLQGSREIESHHGRFYYAPLFGNTHTVVRQFYEDGGVPFVLLMFAVLGLGCSLVYVEIVWRGRAWLMLVHGVIGWCLFISFFSNHWVYFGTWVLFVFAASIGAGYQLPRLVRTWRRDDDLADAH